MELQERYIESMHYQKMKFSILRDHGRRVKEIDERLVHVANVRLLTFLIIHGARSGKMLGGDKTKFDTVQHMHGCDYQHF